MLSQIMEVESLERVVKSKRVLRSKCTTFITKGANKTKGKGLTSVPRSEYELRNLNFLKIFLTGHIRKSLLFD
ncbi:hypothetical protein RclHR1_05390004 [Rhizophagus clarus]|uniref:Uncharacterized protein n=1 Tax=Rhizophagus clarus TaxID=94130 RepID=A0A2Z6S5B4_9GLOM|nr:hypothetical protein RclHR1_05390004 [Rhizophagus clarus]GET00584.1 hypothetical protein RCL_jg1040.t1 [Rhizophagus clarus]